MIIVSDRIAFELMNPTGYIDAVYGDQTAMTDVDDSGGTAQ